MFAVQISSRYQQDSNAGDVQCRCRWVSNRSLYSLLQYLYCLHEKQRKKIYNNFQRADWTYFGPVNGKNQGTENYTYAGDDYLGQTTFTAFDGVKTLPPYLTSLFILSPSLCLPPTLHSFSTTCSHFYFR